MKNNNNNNYNRYNKNNSNQNNNSNNMLGRKSQRYNFNNNNHHYQNNNRNNNYNHHPNNFNQKNDRNGQNSNIQLDSENSNNNSATLPIFAKKQEILEQIKNNRVIIVSGNTGCGKSTQVPQFIFNNEKSEDNKILITQPRRIAAISIAKRLSYEMKNKLGELVGYQVSMISHISKNTQIFVKTTGVFLEELLHDKIEYSYILLDEVHERDLYVDLVLALLKNYFNNFPNSKTKVILMSATIAENEFANYLKEINYNKKN